MAYARLEVLWDLQSCLMALIANIHRDTKTHPKGIRPQDLNPMLKRQSRKRAGSFKDIADDVAVFKRMRKKRMPK